MVFVVCVYNDQLAILREEMKDLLTRFGDEACTTPGVCLSLDEDELKLESRLRIGTGTRLQGMECNACVVAFEGYPSCAPCLHVP